MFERCLYFNTTALARRLEREWAGAFRPWELTPPQAFTLRAVLDRPGSLQREIADALAIARPTLTRALDGLEDKGLIARRGHDRDGREQAVFPTAAAEAIRSALNEASGRVTARLKRVLGAPAFDDAVATIRDVRAAL